MAFSLNPFFQYFLTSTFVNHNFSLDSMSRLFELKTTTFSLFIRINMSEEEERPEEKLFNAARDGELEVVRQLIQDGVDFNTSSEYFDITPLGKNGERS